MNGNAWTKQDIDLLCETVDAGRCVGSLAAHLNRTDEAVFSKARRLGLKVRMPPTLR